MWSCVNQESRKTLSERLEKDNQLFFVDLAKTYERFGLEIVKRKKLYGVNDNKELVVRPLFDEIVLLSEHMVVVRLGKLKALYSIAGKRFISDFEFHSFQVSEGMMVLYDIAGRTSLFDLTGEKFLHKKGDYEEYNLKAMSTEYLWVRKGRFFDFIQRSSGRMVSVAGVVMAYDTEFGIWGLDEHGNVCCFTENGEESKSSLRETVRLNGGYLTLHNFTYNIEHLIDIYGNILNI